MKEEERPNEMPVPKGNPNPCRSMYGGRGWEVGGVGWGGEGWQEVWGGVVVVVVGKATQKGAWQVCGEAGKGRQLQGGKLPGMQGGGRRWWW